MSTPGDSDLAALARVLADAVVIADGEGRISFWNDAAERMFGWPADEAVGQTLDLIIPERHRPRHWDGYRQTAESGETAYADRLLEVPALHQDGHTISIAFTVTILPPSAGATGDHSVAALIRDDTERRAEQRGLRARVAELEGQVPGSGGATPTS